MHRELGGLRLRVFEGAVLDYRGATDSQSLGRWGRYVARIL